MLVRDVMTRGCVSVTPETPLKEVAALLVAHRISGVPVVDAAGAVVGVVSEGDFLRKEAAEPAPRHAWTRLLGGEEAPDAAVATTAGDLMSRPALTIEGGRTLASAAGLMATRGVNRLPVLEDGRLVGIVTRADVVRAYVRSDADLLRAAAHAVHAVDGLRVVEVREGVAVLSGTVADEALAVAVRAVVAGIDGMVAVDDRQVSWTPRDAELEEARWHGAREDLVSG